MPGPEARLSGEVRRLLELCGCHVYSTEAPRVRGPSGSSPGIADLIVLVPGGLVWFVELKAGGGRQTDAQLVFGRRVRNAGGRYEVWRSVDDAKHWCRRYAPRRSMIMDTEAD